MKGPGFVCDHCGHHDVVKSNNEAFRADPTGHLPLGWLEVRYSETADGFDEGTVLLTARTAQLCGSDCLIAWCQTREDANQ